jgi:hypothetical protein
MAFEEKKRGGRPSPYPRAVARGAPRRAIPERKHKLNVPCLGWIYSQAPSIRTPETAQGEIKTPIIIFWVETMPPNFKKRKVYFSYLDEKDSPLRTNLAKAIRRDNSQFGTQGFHVHSTNTSRYFYAVPKIRDTRAAGGEQMFSGYNLWKDYDSTSYIPSYIAPDSLLEEQNIKVPGVPNILSSSRGSPDEQWLYRNLVIQRCQPLEENLDIEEDLKDPTCTTNAVSFPLENPELGIWADLLHWRMDVFLQYLFDNTFRNFQRAGYGNRILQHTQGEFETAQDVLFNDRDYGYMPDGILASPPEVPGDEETRLPIRGLKIPAYPPPWIV